MNQITVAMVTIASAFSLAGCGGSGSGSSTGGARFEVATDYAAVVQTAVYGDGAAIEIIDLEASHWSAVSGFYETPETDYSVWSYGEHFYQIGQSSIDTLMKVNIKNPGLNVWQYSTKASGAATDNPHSLVFKNDKTAYLIAYGSSQSWEIDLEATSADTLKKDTLDLSAYGGGDIGEPEATAGVIVDGKLYVLMQRLASDWSPQTAYIAVFNTTTNNEIDLDIDPHLKGIPLQTRNPQGLAFVEGVGLVVHSVGRYYPQEFSGGIEVVNLADYTTSILVDDGGDYGQISAATIASPEVGYFVAYAGWQDTSVYRFNPTTGDVSAAPVAGLKSVDIRMMSTDPEGRVWIGLADDSNPHLLVIDPVDDSVIDDIATSKAPVSIAFTAVK